jgi:hypothetical protein
MGSFELFKIPENIVEKLHGSFFFFHSCKFLTTILLNSKKDYLFISNPGCDFRADQKR